MQSTSLSLLLSAMLLPMALLLGLLAASHARERHWSWLAAGMGLWSLRGLLAAWPDLPHLAALQLSLLPWAAGGLMLYLLRSMGAQPSWLQLGLLIQALALPLSLWLLPEQGAVLSQGWSLLLMLETAAVLLLRLRNPGLLLGDGPAPALLVGAALALLAELGPWPVLPYALPLLGLALGLQLVLGFSRARDEAERRQLELEQHVQSKVSEIERNYSELAEQKLEQVTERERKRIAADLHDDLGAKLLTIVHTSESDRISTLAREALEEMRLSVRGLTGKPVQLLDALGDWRAEVVSRLGQANILAEWKAPAEDVVHTLPARAYVQTTRILREAVSNIIKHSGATHCIVSCTVQEGDFLVVIQDNGQGISSELDGRLDKGHGMASMKSRAKQMHGQCLVESGPGWGTVIRLTIPL